MNASTNAPAAVEIRRSSLLGLVVGVAAVAASITWALTAYAIGDTAPQGVPAPTRAASSPNQPTAESAAGGAPARARGVTTPIRKNALSSLTPQERRYLKAMTAVCSVVMCPPNEGLAAMVGFATRKK